MAPTEILAEQHFAETASAGSSPLGITRGLAHRQPEEKERREMLALIASWRGGASWSARTR